MGDKPKSKTKEDIASTMVACGNTSDQSSRNITASLIADNLAGGAKGSAMLAGARGVEGNIGSCIAKFYDEPDASKKPSAWESLSSKVSGLTDSFKSAASGAAATVSEMKNDLAIKPFQGATEVDRYNRQQADPGQRL